MNIQSVCDFKTLLVWLSREMDWNTGIDDFQNIDDITYDFDAGDIHLKPEEFAKISSLKQLRPLYEHQPWGIFAVEFEGKRFEVSSLRKILSGLVPKRRNRDHAVWNKENLLFFCFWGEKTNRCFGAVYFQDKTQRGFENALPAIKALHIAPKNEDQVYLQSFTEKLKKLSWPNLPQKPTAADFQEWHNQWAGAFTSVYRQTIRDSKELTASLAEIALNIRLKILDIFSVETESGSIHELYNKFKKALIHTMTEKEFADMYAQTIVYGLFSARCMNDLLNGEGGQENEHSVFDPKRAIDSIPSTNPFLQNLLKESFSRKNKLSFDELDLGDIALLLQNTDTNLIIEDFNRQTGGGKEDPVLYFYEGFLNVYEKEQKKRRGVYYTPLPVVKFMVQAVDDILKQEFGVKDGLASTETKTVSIPKKKDGKAVAAETKDVPAIQILDPAVGTATYLRQIILQIWENFKNANAGQSKNSIKNRWNIYVKENLLPRLNGFELMMAPYAVAHMKLALVLLDTGYAFDEDETHPDRVNVFLTNSLEEADKEENQGMMFEHDALAEESRAAKETKKNRGINVVIGNPPYSGESANKGGWILSLLDDYKKEPGGAEKLQERNPKWINDDYVKFIRYAQYYVERAGSGVIAYINNHGFLDNPTFRGMRWNLLTSFDKIYIIDLHGNSKKKETAADGSKDENVFDIQQGVSINIFVKKGRKSETTEGTELHGVKDRGLAEVFHCDLYGLREEKYDILASRKMDSVQWNKLTLSAPQFFFAHKNFENQAQYENGFSVQDLFLISSVGIVTANDGLFINKDKKLLKENIVSHFKENDANKKYIKEIAYRPFDTQYIYYDTDKLERPREKVMRHFIDGENVGLILGRQGQVVGSMIWNLVFISSNMVDLNLYYRGGGNIFPLYLYEDKKCRQNFNSAIITKIAQKLNLPFAPEPAKEKTPCTSVCNSVSSVVKKESFSPIDLFDYIYAVLHSPAYRETYREFLKIDFPRIPYPAEAQTFSKLAALGGKLRSLHLLEGAAFEAIEAEPAAAAKVPVQKIRYIEGKVFVNGDFFFDNVPETAWNFYIGGYQPAQKWLKDRKGCILQASDIKHYRKIVFALEKTAEVMGEIDGVGVV